MKAKYAERKAEFDARKAEFEARLRQENEVSRSSLDKLLPIEKIQPLDCLTIAARLQIPDNQLPAIVVLKSFTDSKFVWHPVDIDNDSSLSSFRNILVEIGKIAQQQAIYNSEDALTKVSELFKNSSLENANRKVKLDSRFATALCEGLAVCKHSNAPSRHTEGLFICLFYCFP